MSDSKEALGRFKRWKPAAQQRALEEIRAAQLVDWHPFYCPNIYCNGQPHCWPADDRPCPNAYGHTWRMTETGHFLCAPPEGASEEDAKRYCGVEGMPLDDWLFPHSRTDQRPPPWKKDWLTLFLRGGRGSGKTRTGSEITNRVTKKVPLITLIGATGPDLRNIMIEGESGILATSPPGERPKWEPSKKLLTWPNGCKAQGYSAEEPDRLRGQNSGYVWGDEPAHWKLARESWDNMLFGLRKGEYPKIVATSTPKPSPFVKETLADPYTVDRVVSTYANLSNLASLFRRVVVGRFEGTRTGQQELMGELLEDVEGSMWKWEMIQYVEPDDLPEMKTIVVGIDPAGTQNKKSDETGIVVVGLGHDDNFYVLADYTDKYSPEGWGTMAHRQYEEWQADALVPERNYGEDMVIFVLEKTVTKGEVMPRIKAARSRRGKDIRAEPVVALYEKGRVYHLGEMTTDHRTGEAIHALQKLDEELCTWVPFESASPNRLDALVHAITEIGKVAMPSELAIPSEVLKDMPIIGASPYASRGASMSGYGR